MAIVAADDDSSVENGVDLGFVAQEKIRGAFVWLAVQTGVVFEMVMAVVTPRRRDAKNVDQRMIDETTL